VNKVMRVVGMTVGGILATMILGAALLAAKGPSLRAAPSLQIERTEERIARGRYLAEHVMDCVGCHSDHEWSRFSSPVKPSSMLAGGFIFDEKYGIPGRVAAQNLTPDPETGKGRWTDGELVRAIREGVSRDGRALFPMMPYEAYRQMADDDVEAIVAYLRTVPPVKNVIPPSEIAFPVNLFINFVPRPIDRPISRPNEKSDPIAYQRYLVALSGCRDCHSPHDNHGKILPGQDYTGGWDLVGPWGRVVTPNLTPDPETFVGRASKQEFVARFKAFETFTATSAPTADPNRNTVMPWIAFAGMRESDLGAIYDFLKQLPPVKHNVVVYPNAK
jgi:mono/diheme cytochrome c family protein